MERDYFSILGLTPGCYSAREVDARFRALRDHLAGITPDDDAVRAQREVLYVAYRVLRDPRGQKEYLAALRDDEPPIDRLRRQIAASLEYDLLRHSRRQALLEEGRRIGLSDFQTQLLIAQVQFGDDLQFLSAGRTAHRSARAAPPSGGRVGLRLAAAGLLALALFVVMERYLAPALMG